MTDTEQSVGKRELQVPFGDCTDSRSPCSVLPEPSTGALPCRCSFLSLECSAPFSVFIQVQFVSVSRGSCLQTKKPYLPLSSSKRKVPRGSDNERGPGGWPWTMRWKPRRSPERLGPHLRNHLVRTPPPQLQPPWPPSGPRLGALIPRSEPVGLAFGWPSGCTQSVWDCRQSLSSSGGKLEWETALGISFPTKACPRGGSPPRQVQGASKKRDWMSESPSTFSGAHRAHSTELSAKPLPHQARLP